MIVPHPTLQLSLFMKFRFFDVLGITHLLSGHATVGNIEWLNNILSMINIFPETSKNAFVKSIIDSGAMNLNNSFWPLIIMSLCGLGFKNGLYIFMMRQFFRGVPDELEESAYIDGSGVFRTFIQIILPLSVPMMITVFLFAFSWQWTDDFYTNLFFVTSDTNLLVKLINTIPTSLPLSGLFITNKKLIKLMPDMVDIPKVLETNYAGQNMYYSAIRNTCGLVIIFPLVIMYLFCQRYLVQGIERSGLTAD